ncbi:MAG: phage integrase N-terminal SAM-like domain-containing protein [Clostridia bacterium]|nr:phage integrase N-terminal SAM-like domain-containing protein [Clostridia bacterium]
MRKITTEQIARYKGYLIDEEKGKVTIEKYIHDVLTFAEWLGGRELTKTEALEYKSSLVERYAAATVNSVLSSLNSFFGYNEWYDLKVKSLKIQRQMFCKSETELTKEEYQRLLKAAEDKRNERLSLVMQTICATGIRVSEDI